MESTPLVKLSKVQRISLLIASFLLAILLFVLRLSFAPTNSLEKLARNSLEPEIALSNGRPTIIEFYADWCEACQEMAPTIISLKEQNHDEINIVLLNVDNERWLDLIEKYKVTGIPQLDFFDELGAFKGESIGLKSIHQLEQIAYSLLNNKPLPEFPGVRSDISSFTPYLKNNNISPRSHS
ncbi:thioredoxin domain-containing protein [Prochlorococcus marinus]|uniref:thioredoxin domain-containing protein n=1 Tax=Prochlorococcus marinus TaxID=1219 RepID=UPI0022B485AD|nr:thioredoxin domain-containing protein [Prochlorococcus marinus]